MTSAPDPRRLEQIERDILTPLQRFIQRSRVQPTDGQIAFALDKLNELRAACSVPQDAETEDEPLHTGDDARLDVVTSLRAGLEEIVNAEDDEYEKHEIIELLRELFDDCDQLDVLLIETIKRERLALGIAPAAQPEQRTECCNALIDWRDRFCPRCGWECRATLTATVSAPPHHGEKTC